MQVLQCPFVVAHSTVAGGQGAVGTGYLVDVAIVLENVQGFLSQPDGQLVVVDAHRVDQLHARYVFGHQLVKHVGDCQVLSQRLQCVSCEIGVMVTLGYLQATQQVVELLLGDIVLGALCNDATRSDVVEIVQELGRVLLHILRCLHQGINALLLQSYIIIIGGTDDGQFRFSIEQPLLLALCQQLAFLIDASQGFPGPFAVVIELTVMGAALTQAHLLHVSHQQFQLVVGNRRDGVEQLSGLVIVHADDAHEGQMIQGLGLTVAVACRLLGSLAGKVCGGIK